MIKGQFSGEVKVAGLSLKASRPRELAGRVGLLFQDFEAQLFSTRVDLEVAFGPENLGLPRAELTTRVDAALSLVGLSAMAHRDPATLSGGQKQLLALAAVLSSEPQLLVLDEPLSDLDPLRVEELLDNLERLSRRRGLTLVLLGEDLRLARIASRVVLLHQGKIAADGPPSRVLQEVAAFRRLGLRPPELPALFHYLGESVLPLTLTEALSQARRRGWDKFAAAVSPPGESGKDATGTGIFTPTLTLPRQRGVENGDSRTIPGAGAGSETGPELIALRRVSFAYPGSPPLFEDFSFSLRRGELTAILGPNGSGKTTLLNLLRSLLKPQAGEVWTTPQDPPLNVGFVFQNPDYQLFQEQVWEEVAWGPRLMGFNETQVKERVEAALNRVHLLSLAEEDPFSLTKGQRQRLAVAGVLALAPQVIILDEPTTGLDYRERRDLLDLIRELHAQGHAIVMVTHSMWAAATYARRLVVLDRGRVVLDGPTREVLAQEEILAASFPAPPLVN